MHGYRCVAYEEWPWKHSWPALNVKQDCCHLCLHITYRNSGLLSLFKIMWLPLDVTSKFKIVGAGLEQV